MGLLKEFGKFSIRSKLMYIVLLLILVPMLLLGTLSYNASKKGIHEEARTRLAEQIKFVKEDIGLALKLSMQQVNSNLKLADEILYGFGTPYLDENNNLVIKNKETNKTIVVNNDNTIVDKIQSIVGGRTSIFELRPAKNQSEQEYLISISSNIVDKNGNRIVNRLASKTVHDSILSGNTFYGRTMILGEWYITAYSPIRDENGSIVGALYVGVEQDKHLEPLKDFIASIKVGKTGYIYVMDSDGRYVVSKNRMKDGLLLETFDKQGNHITKEIIRRAKKLPEGEIDEIRYFQKNEDVTINPIDLDTIDMLSDKQMIAVFGYFDELDYVVVSESLLDEFEEPVREIRNLTIIILLITIVIGTILVYVFADYLSTPIEKIAYAFGKVADHDFTHKLGVVAVGKNEIGHLTKAYDAVVSSTKNLVMKINKNMDAVEKIAKKLLSSSEEVSSATEQISATTQEISKGAQSQSRDVTKTARIMADMNKKINEVSSKISSVSESSALAKKSASEGKIAAAEAEENTAKIKDIFTSTNESISKLGERSKEIGKIVDVINNISEQTNLLALNATIEAARAGEAGKGFSVVADEIRKLAEDSQNATKQISELISDIQNSTDHAVESIRSGTKGVEEGAEVIGEALDSLNGISDIITKVDEQTKEIVGLAKEQVSYTKIVDKAIADVSAVAEETAAGTEEMTASIEETTASVQDLAITSQELIKGAEELKEDIKKFRF